MLVTAHDVVNLMFCYVAEGMDEDAVMERARTNGMRNAAICRLVSDDESPTGWRLLDYNLDEHLRDAGIAVTDQPGAADDIDAHGSAQRDEKRESDDNASNPGEKEASA